MARRSMRRWLLGVALGGAALGAGVLPALAANPVATPVLAAPPGRTNPEAPEPPPPSLKGQPIPGPKDLDTLVVNQTALKQLGKALFWDMQVGSDGIQSCATCHFHAGTDGRLKHQLNPGPNNEFEVKPINGTLTPDDFPFHKRADPDAPTQPPHSPPVVLRDSDDIASSQGVHPLAFQDIQNQAEDKGAPKDKGRFHVNGVGVRQVEPRNTPTVINSVFNLRNFWDGRANRFFNGRDPFGDQVSSFILVRDGNGKVVPKTLKLRHSSLASQAVGPPNNNVEMAFDGRTFPKLGKKLMRLIPLVRQDVDPEDSLLGPLRHGSGKGLAVSYRTLIRRAFRPELWDAQVKITCHQSCDRYKDLQVSPLEEGESLGTNQFNLMEYNFALFFGLAIQAYEATLVSDETPYDRWREGDERALTDEQKVGLDVFMRQGHCFGCHRGPEFTSAGTFHLIQEENERGLMERMQMSDGSIALYDNGFYNIGVRPTHEDLGVGGNHPNGRPLSFSEQFVQGRFNEVDGCKLDVPFDPQNCEWIPPVEERQKENRAVKGAFKTPTLRNVELTGPYMHNGGMSTLEQVMDFYNRGGDFKHQDPDVRFLGLSDQEKQAVVAFMKALTDERVRYEKAPFDHPQLCIPNGHPGKANKAVDRGDGYATDTLLNVAAVGKWGGPALPTFEEMLREGRNRHVDGPCAIAVGDTARPRVSPPTFRVAVGEQLAWRGKRVPLDVQWSGSDKGSGIARYELQQQTNGRGWKQVRLSEPAGLSALAWAKPGDRVQFRLRGADLAGNKSHWVEGPVLTVKVYEETHSALTLHGNWERQTSGGPSGGTYTKSETQSAKVEFTFQGREVALVGLRAPPYGGVEVLLDGVYVETLDLSAHRTIPRLVLTGRRIPSGGSHSVTLRSTGEGWVSVDAFIVLE